MTYKKIANDLLIFILFFLIWFILFRFTGSFTKGYNIYEDYSIINLGLQLKNNSIPSVTYNYVKRNLESRARLCPVGDFHRVLSIKIFGANYTLYTLYVVFLGILTSFFLYKFCKVIGFSFLESFLFGILVFAGPFSVIWSEIANYESLGMLLLSLSLFFLAKSIYSPTHESQYKIWFIIFLTLTCLTKENFIILIPAVIFLYLWLYSSKNKTGFIISIKQNYKVITALSVIMLTLLLLIFLLVGINSQNYAGLDAKAIGYGSILNLIVNLFNYNIFWIILFGLLIILFDKLKNTKQGAGKNFTENYLKNLFNVSILFFLITVPQYILHLKTGLAGRYLLPFMLGFSFYLVYVLKIIFDSNSISRIVKYLYLSAITIFLFFELKNNTVPRLLSFSNNCKATTNLVNSVVENSKKESTILFVMDPVQNFHEVYSLKIYLNYLEAPRNFKYEFIKKEYLHRFFSDTSVYNAAMNSAIEELGKDLIDSVNDKEIFKSIIIFTQLKSKFLEQNKNWFKEENYVGKNFGGYSAYYKK